jgi:hypothetical protein
MTVTGWIVAAIMVALFNVLFYFVPTFIIGRRMGLSAWWMLFWLLPIAALWVLAIRGWPTLAPRKSN